MGVGASVPPAQASAAAGGHAGTAVSFNEITIHGGMGRNGIYDPSIEYDSDGTGWMTYSTVEIHVGVGTHVARSRDRGRTWQHVGAIQMPRKGSVRTPEGKTVQGAWWHEVSTLVHDPKDAGREWKLYWHHYFARNKANDEEENRMFDFGWIATRSAPSPAGPWSKEEPLLGVGPFPRRPYTTRVNITTLHPKLAEYAVLTEPGSLCFENTLYLSLQAFSFRRKTFDIVLLASADHGRTWQYAGTPLRGDEAKPFGADHFAGSSLARERGRAFLLVCPELKGKKMLGHQGTVILEFKDLASGALKRTAAGTLDPVKFIRPLLASGGQSDYDEKNTAGGVVMPQFDMKNLPRPWRIYSTGERILGRSRGL